MTEIQSDIKLEFSTKLAILQNQLDRRQLIGEGVYEYLRLFMIGASASRTHVGLPTLNAFITIQKSLKRALIKYPASSTQPPKLSPRVVEVCGNLTDMVLKLLEEDRITELDLAASAISVTEAIYGAPIN